ncbi:putative lipoprotein [Mycoplasmopsis mustelae]|uniref:Putative lipoprotein n=1 Tax=Mycoplasmopsis mustelae TaxID=171289 RepID=A0A4R7UDF8_9BACT|nr:hypothetical protein [Mycoplasmopsis mustelae]TDV24507.1 putative lipoprotein [Mycoplasmopsis mustelae]
MKKIKFWTFFTTIAASTTTIITSCAKNEMKVVFSTSQGQYFPLIMALKEIIPLYNQTMKDNPNFLPVELLTSRETNTDSELELANINASYIQNKDVRLANLFLGNQSGAFLINKYGKLLDTSTIFKSNIFTPKILKTHTNLVGEKLENTKIFNLPFDDTDIDGLSINVDLLNRAFDFLKQANAKIDEDSKIYKYMYQRRELGNNIPKNSIINYLKVKDNANLTGYTINDKTFNGISSLYQLARKLKSILEFDSSKIQNLNKDTNINDLAIFTIDERDDAFFKVLNNKLKGIRPWELEVNNDKYDFSKVKYNIKTDTNVKNAFIETFDEFVKENSTQKLNDAVFQDVKYENQSNEWGSWALRRYQAIFSFVANVGYEQSVDSTISRLFYEREGVETRKQWATKDDIYLQQQLTKNNADDDFSTYIEGGSNIIPISVDNGGKRDKATLLFLKWLYTQDINYQGQNLKVSDLLSQKSGYIIPLSKNLEANFNWYNNQQKYLEDKIKEKLELIKTNHKDREQIQNQIDKLSTEINYLYAANTTFKGLKEFEKSTTEDILWLPINEKTSAIIEKVRQLLLESTLKNNPKIITGQQAYQEIINIIDKK